MARISTHPGEFLSEDLLRPLGMSVAALSLALRVPASRLSAIVKGKRAVTADTAMRLGRYFRTTPNLWMNLQAAYDLSKAQVELGTRIKREIKPRLV